MAAQELELYILHDPSAPSMISVLPRSKTAYFSYFQKSTDLNIKEK